MLLGSDAEQVVRAAGVPVLLVPAPTVLPEPAVQRDRAASPAS